MRPTMPAGFAPAAVVLAVKPQNAAATLPAVSRAIAGGAVFLSIMAGRTIAGMRGAAGRRRRDRARDAEHAGGGAPGHHRRLSRRRRDRRRSARLCDDLLQAIGVVAWVEDEALLDPVTAVSGSGPAYVFLLAELMEQAAIEQGIPPDLARLLARQTVAGSGALLAASDGGCGGAARGRHQPGRHHRGGAGGADGATGCLAGGAQRAIAAATARSRELAG